VVPAIHPGGQPGQACLLPAVHDGSGPCLLSTYSILAPRNPFIFIIITICFFTMCLYNFRKSHDDTNSD
jgi:hypothetical protein